jgi:hypothetical protein
LKGITEREKISELLPNARRLERLPPRGLSPVGDAAILTASGFRTDHPLARPWGAPRIHGELLKLGIDVCQTTVAKYMAKRRRPPSQGWRTFVHSHADAIASIDMFVVPTISFGLLHGLLILRQSRRELAAGPSLTTFLDQGPRDRQRTNAVNPPRAEKPLNRQDSPLLAWVATILRGASFRANVLPTS